MAREIATDLEQHVAASINAERAAAGLAELKLEVHLNASAQAHSDWMSETGTFSHTGEDGSTATDRIGDAGFPLTGSWQTAENLAYVSIAGGLDAGELDTMHEGLMDSEGHRANILDPNAAYVGVGLSVGEISVAGIDQPVVYLTEHFADTDGEVLVQEEIDGETVLQPHQDGEPTGDPEPAVASSHDGADEGTNDPEEDEEQEPETAAAGGCFVATAAYGSWSHPDVGGPPPLPRRGPRPAPDGPRLHPRLPRRRSEARPPRLPAGRLRPRRPGAYLAPRAPRPQPDRRPAMRCRYRPSPSARWRASPLSTSETPRRLASSRIRPCSSALIPSAAATRHSASTTPARSS